MTIRVLPSQGSPTSTAHPETESEGKAGRVGSGRWRCRVVFDVLRYSQIPKRDKIGNREMDAKSHDTILMKYLNLFYQLSSISK